MAKALTIETKVVAKTDEAKQSVKEFSEELDNLKSRSRKASSDAVKDWGGFANLFSGLLPRNVQAMIRKFQSTQRAVGRLSTSLKFLKGALTGLGIGVLLLALESLIENWEKINDLITGNTEEVKRNKAILEAQTEAQNRAILATQSYYDIINDTTQSLETRREAQNELGRSIAEVKDLDIESEEGLNALRAATERYIAVERERAQQNVIRQALEKNLLRNADDELAWYDKIWGKWTTERRAKKAQNEIDQERLNLENQLEQSRTNELTWTAEITAELEKQRLERERIAEAEREAERLRQERQRNLEYVQDLEQELDEAAILRGLEEKERAAASIALEYLKAKERAEAAGASFVLLKKLEDEYNARIEESNARYEEEEERLRQKKIDEEKQLMTLLNDEYQSQADKELQLLTEKYDQLILLHGDHANKKAAIDEWYDNQVKKIEAQANARQIKDNVAVLNAKLKAAETISSNLERLAEDGSEAQKALAISSVLLNQAQAMSSAIAAAVSAAAATGPAAPVVTPLLIAQLVGIVIGGFAQVKSILNQAGASTGAVGRGGSGARGGMQTSLIPQGIGNREYQMPAPSQAYVVQSQLQGQMHMHTSLQKRIHL